MNNELYPLILEPTIKNYIWGGRKFQSFLSPDQDKDLPIAEIWTIYENNLIKNGELAGKSLAEIQKLYGKDLLGEDYSLYGGKFPLLIKLLDSQDWLSIQVHPNNGQAQTMQGACHFGKTEAWFVLDATDDAQLIAGVEPGIDQNQLIQAIRQGKIASLVKYHHIKKDNYIFIRAGTIHALGPGATIYEIQQNSDITYRVYDWDRPATAGRPLHPEESIAVIDPKIDVKLGRVDPEIDMQDIITSEYFQLRLLRNNGNGFSMNPAGKSFQALTVIEGIAALYSKFGNFLLKQYDSILVPANHPPYHLSGNFKILCGSLNSI